MSGLVLSQVIQYFLSGATTGSVYALIALGFTIVHSVTGIINFAQGEFVMLGGMVTYLFFRSLHLPLWLASLFSVATVTLVGLLLERVALRQSHQASVVSLIMVTIGASIFLRGVAGEIWGKNPLPLPAFSGEKPIVFFGAAIQPQSLWVIGVMLFFTLLFHLLMSRTLLGKALRACSLNRRAAEITGINVRGMSLLSFGAAAALGAIGGIVIAPMTLTAYDIGVILGLKGFVAAAMGGLSSQPGAVIGGLALGILEAFGAAYLSSAYKDAIALFVFFVFLLARARSLSGSEF
ncbi:MAG: branched-chain amino acid ABC transporter permease [Chloroflexota bacterium]